MGECNLDKIDFTEDCINRYPVKQFKGGLTMEIKTKYHKELREIKDNILVLGTMVSKATIQAITPLQNEDLTLAREVIADNLTIKAKCFEMEEKCVQLIATDQSLETELRCIVSLLYVINELERIGDYAKDDAKIILMIGKELRFRLSIDLPRMAEKTVDMLNRSLSAFVNHDADAARKLITEDNFIHQFHDQIFLELQALIAKDYNTINRASLIISLVQNIDHSADRITNICERTVIMVTGKMGQI